MNSDIRWHQRLTNFESALIELTTDLAILKTRSMNRTEQKGLIQSFEFTYELAWNCLKDFYTYQGESDIAGSRDAIRLAFKRGLIENGETWMDMIKSRALTVHTYNKDTASQISKKIISDYYPEFAALRDKLYKIKSENK